MATHAIHKLWLKVAAVIIGCFGPLLTLATLPAFDEPARFVLDLLSWPLDGFPSYEARELRFLSALTGGFLVGWAVLVWALSEKVYDHAPEAVRRSLLASAAAWFVFDSTGSVTSGNWPNVLWNTLILALVVGPLWRPAADEPKAQGDPS